MQGTANSAIRLSEENKIKLERARTLGLDMSEFLNRAIAECDLSNYDEDDLDNLLLKQQEEFEKEQIEEKAKQEEEFKKQVELAKMEKIKQWLFSESVRINNENEAIKERYEKVQACEKALSEKFDSAYKKFDEETKKTEAQMKKLEFEKELFEEKLKILHNGFHELENDRKDFEYEKQCFEMEKSSYYNEGQAFDQTIEYSAQGAGKLIEFLFRGANTQALLKKRYRELIKVYHPDNMSGDKGMMAIIQNGYDTLKNKVPDGDEV